jgi:L-ascorbate metabolism protein UlaG (beta-lactamase superfamily)
MKAKILIFSAMMFSQADQQPANHTLRMEKGRLFNPKLTFIHPPEGWTGNKINTKNQFENIDSTRMPSLGDVLRWKLKKNPQKAEKKADRSKLSVVRDSSFLYSQNDVIVWLGHATFYIRIGGISLITDPVFYDIPFVNRHHELPFNPALITGLDYILVSHNHRDHCDKKSLKLLAENNPGANVLTGLRIQKLIGKWISNPIQEAGWFQKYTTPKNINIVYLPTQHWSKRLFDTNKSLWGAFSLEINGKRIYFGGDTGWGTHFSYTGKHFGPFDVCILPVGAYSPRWFMKSSHINPSEAVESFRLLNGAKLYPMHYGSYDLSDEPMGEPIKLLSEAFEAVFEKDKVIIPPVGKANNI